jgi:hypothetical protein
MNAEQFRATPEFAHFKGVMRKLLAVPKEELDRRVREAKSASERVENPNAPGRKKNIASLKPD